MDTSTIAAQRNFSICAVVTSCCVFTILGKVVEAWLTPAAVVKSQRWRWKNIAVSFVHSSLTGICALLCFYETPKMAEDLISTFTSGSFLLVSISVGYFFADVFDMLYYNRTRKSYELLLHHTVVILCFGSSLMGVKYIGYSVVALVVEINSIFLHSRQLLQMLNVVKNDSLYRINSLLNMGTFIVFRIATLAWMTRWIVVNRDLIPLALYTLGSVGLAVMTIMNIILFYRLLKSDFLKSHREKECMKQD